MLFVTIKLRACKILWNTDDSNILICAIPNEKVEFMLVQLNRTDKVLVEYNSLEDMVEDGWCMGL